MKKRQSQRLLQENDPSASHPLSQTEDNSDLPPDQSVEPIVQESLLDTRQVVLQESVFRGFLHLAWICMIIGCAGVLAKNIRVTGQLIGFNFYHALTTDLRNFVMADLLMFCSLYIALAIQVLIRRGWIPLRLAPFLRHAFQGCLIGGAVYYSHEQGWFYVQKFWFVMHTLAMFMKVHSFSLMNEKLHETWLKSGKRKKGVLLPKEAIGKLNIFERRHAKDLIYYPYNLNIRHFSTYLFTPVLTYQLNFPITNRIRMSYILEKIFSGFACLLAVYLIVENWIQPIIFELEAMSVIGAMIELLLPFLLVCLILFYFVFECLCCTLAEFMYYGNRQFYDDWWNSQNFEEFARKWNKPVHHFLYLHVYQEALLTYKVSKVQANFITFLFSSILHELVLTIMCGGSKIKIYFFFLQMLQIPLIYIGRLSFFSKHPTFANLGFWFALILGFPLVTLLYCRDYFLTENWRQDFPYLKVGKFNSQ